MPIGPHRRFAFVRQDLADFKRVKDALGGTVNDVVLAVVAGALRQWLRSRGVRTEGIELRALVPVSIRAADQHHTMGNRIAAMRGPLPVYVEDPVARLAVVREAMDGLKESKQAIGAEVLAGVQSFAPPTVLAQASRINFSTRLFNLIVTNVPGPQFPLYLLGRELQDLFPVAFLPRDHAMAIAIMSYNGGIDFGLLGDYDAMPDLDEFGRDLEVALEELVVAAKKQSKGTAKGAQARPGLEGSVAERELRVLGHLVRGPRRREDHVRHDLLDALDLAHELLHLLGDLGPDRARGGRQRERDGHRAAVDLDAVDEPELDEVEPQLRVDHVAESLGDFLFVDDHSHDGTPEPCTNRSVCNRLPRSSVSMNSWPSW